MFYVVYPLCKSSKNHATATITKTRHLLKPRLKQNTFLNPFRSYVAFSDKNRILGVAAKNQQVTNMKNTVYGLKRLLGRKFQDPHVQREIQSLPFNILEDKSGNIGIKVCNHPQIVIKGLFLVLKLCR